MLTSLTEETRLLLAMSSYPKKELILTKDEIAQRIKSLGLQISQDYKDKELILVGVLKGVFTFMADLARSLSIPVKIDFARVASYGSKTRPGKLRLTKDVELPVKGKHILIIEDIIDTGRTISYLKKKLQAKKPASVKICALVDKMERRKVPIDIDYLGFGIEKGFIVGYGLDFDERFRELPEIYTLIF